MGSLCGGKRRKAMWLYPKVMGFNPSERWGHSACLADGVLYVFGGCCGGLHFSDVLTLNLDTMTWSSLATTGHKPGTRDSHSAVIVGQRMAVLGGTNGTKKVNDLHILDLRTKEWSKPTCKGTPPCPRESHTATLVGEDRLVIFGGSGEGEANYLNDVHVLDIKTMMWTSPEVKGDPPAPRDSHTAVAMGDKLVIYGGDCGDRYHGEVDVLDTDTMTWSRLMVQGSSPGVRAGHATVTIGTKVYIIGGVGDKQYYSDVWVLDVGICAWTQLDIRGQQPQGRFSHTAVVANADIAIYGGCGEDERPLNELLILQLGSEHPNGRYNVSMCKIFGSHWSQEKKKFLREDNLQNVILKNGDSNQKSPELDVEKKASIFRSPDNLRAKRRRVNDTKVFDMESEQEEHSLSLSQHSSPSQSDQEQNTVQKLSSSNKGHKILSSQPQFAHFKWKERACLDAHGVGGEEARNPKAEQFLRAVAPPKHEMQLLTSDQKSAPVRPIVPPLFGAEVHGVVDGAFDSGYLMTANVKGQIFRGVLFAPVGDEAVEKCWRLGRVVEERHAAAEKVMLSVEKVIDASIKIIKLHSKNVVEEKIDETYGVLNQRLHHTNVLFHSYFMKVYSKCSDKCFYKRNFMDKMDDCIRRCEYTRFEAANLMKTETSKLQGPSVAVPRQLTHSQNPATCPQQSTTPSPSIPAHVRPPQQTNFLLQEGGHHVRHPNAVHIMKPQSAARLNSDLQGVVLTLGGPGGATHGGA